MEPQFIDPLLCVLKGYGLSLEIDNVILTTKHGVIRVILANSWLIINCINLHIYMKKDLDN